MPVAGRRPGRRHGDNPPAILAMPPRQSAAVDRALARVAAGQTAYAAAKAEGIALSTIYRALKRHRERRQ